MLVAVGRSFCVGWVAVGWSLLVVVGWLLWVGRFMSVALFWWSLYVGRFGRFVSVVLCWSLCVGHCETLAVGRVVVDWLLVSVFVNQRLLLTILRENMACTRGNLNRPLPLQY